MSSNDKRDNPDGKPDNAAPSATPGPGTPDKEAKSTDTGKSNVPPAGKAAASTGAAGKGAADKPAVSKTATDKGATDKAAVGKTADDKGPADKAMAAKTAADKLSADKALAGKAAPGAAAAGKDAAKGAGAPGGKTPTDKPSSGRDAAGAGRDSTSAKSGGTGGTPPPPRVSGAAPEKRSGGFVPGLVGGIAAAAVGFGAAQFLDVDWVKLRGGEDPVAAQLAQQNTAITGQSQSIATLESRLEEISKAVASPDLSSMETTISGLADKVESEVGSLSSGIVTQLGQVTQTLSGLSDAVGTIENRLTGVDGTLTDLGGGLKDVTDQLGTVDERLSGVDDRLVAVEKRPMVESSETAKSTFDAYEREVQRLTDELSAQQEESAATAKRMAELASLTEQQITAVQEEAAARLAAMQAEASSQIDATQAQTDAKLQEAQTTAQSAAVTAALISLEKSLEEGTPYADALATLGDSVEVPDALSAQADSGVQTLMQLRDSYPEAARAALEASIRATSTEADPVGKLTAFFRHQTGARSLAPKEGDDADAVLSRAEASVDSGDIPAALTEIDALPNAGQAAMADWTSAATARVSAVAAAATLVASLQTN